MCRHKVYGLSPRDCLKTTLFQKWQRIVAPPGQFMNYRIHKVTTVLLTFGYYCCLSLNQFCLLLDLIKKFSINAKNT